MRKFFFGDSDPVKDLVVSSSYILKKDYMSEKGEPMYQKLDLEEKPYHLMPHIFVCDNSQSAYSFLYSRKSKKQDLEAFRYEDPKKLKNQF